MRKKWLKYGLWILLILFCVGCKRGVDTSRPVAKPADPGVMLVAGSGSNIALTRRIAAEYSRQSGQKVDVPGSIGTTGAIRAIRDGAISLGLASRALTPEEKAQGLNQIRYASIGLAIVVNPSVPETDIDTRNLVQIYSGQRKTWRNGADIIALCMYEGDSTNEVLLKQVPGFSVALEKGIGAARLADPL